MTLTVLLLSFGSAFANERDSVCNKTSSARVVREVTIPGRPSYFMRPFPDGKRVAMGTEDGNIVIDLETSTVRKVPGEIDPVPLATGEAIAVPSPVTYNYSSKKYETLDDSSLAPGDNIRFHVNNREEVYETVQSLNPKSQRRIKSDFSVDDLLKRKIRFQREALAFYDTKRVDENGKAKALNVDISMPGSYQSIGATAKGVNGVSIQRVIMDVNGLQMRDYATKMNAGGEYVVNPVGKTRPLCPGQYLQLPMLNKTGSEVAGMDHNSQRGLAHRLVEI
ncbi:MAG: hypothetical protein AB7G93_01110 [Bdellovibrionales bacterium]